MLRNIRDPTPIGSVLEPIIDNGEGENEDYDCNKWFDFVVREYGICYVGAVGDTQPPVGLS